MKHRTGYLFKRGNTFSVQWQAGGKRFVKVLRDANGQPITSKREAEEARDAFMAPMAVTDEAKTLQAIAGKLEGAKAELAALDEKQNPPMLITQTWSEYLASSKRPDTGPDTLAVYKGQFGQFVDWMAGQYPSAVALRDVTEEIADAYSGHLNYGRLSPNTFNKHIRVLELVFRTLFKKAKLTSNPWEDIQRKSLTTSSRRELTLEELRRVCQGATGDLRPLFALGIFTGLRLKDCCTLRWGEVDLIRGIIRRVPSKTARRRPDKSVQLPIHPSLRQEIDQLKRGESDFLLPQIATAYTGGGASKKRLINRIQDHFTNEKVAIYRPGTGPGTGNRAVVEVGFHSLRHSFVSMCRANNVPLSVVEALVGHSNPSMTKHYTHTGEIAAASAVAGLPALLGEAAPANVKRTPETILSEARAIAESITGKNWREKQAALMAVLQASLPG